MSTTKVCTQCGIDKPLTDFGKHACMKDNIRSACKACGVKVAIEHSKKYPEMKTSRNKRYREKHREGIKVKQKVHRGRNTEKQREYIRNWYLIKTYGITADDYNDMFIEQGGCCAICGIHQGEIKTRLHVDHCHETGKVRGLLCSPCNNGLGRFGDNTDLLRNAIKYLEAE